MKYEVSDVDKAEMAQFLERIFGEMQIQNDEVRRINGELSEFGYELNWSECSGVWEIYYR